MTVILLLSFLSGAFGCGKKKNYDVDDIVSLSTSYFGMEIDPVYSFALQKREGRWFFSASCLTGVRKEHYASFGFFEIPDDDAVGLFNIISGDGEIDRLEKYRNTPRIFHISDAPARSLCIEFGDGYKIEKDTEFGRNTLDYLHVLADKYCSSAEKETITSVSASCSAMSYSSAYSYLLEKKGKTWFFSFDTSVDCGAKRIRAKNRQISGDSAGQIIAIVKAERLINKVRQYKEPDEDVFALDAAEYAVSINFSDGSRLCAPVSPGDELTEVFCGLAKKYKQNVKIYRKG